MKCPKCGIRAAKHAISCFCGYEFTASNPKESSTGSYNSTAKDIEPESVKSEQAEPVSEENFNSEPSSGDTLNDTPEPPNVKAEEPYQQAPRFDNSVPRYDKVGGWLLLLCVSLTILGPFATFYNLIAGYSGMGQLFEATPGLRTLYNIDTTMSVGLGLYSLWAGFSLWTRMEGAVERAKKYLYAVLGYSAILYFLPAMSGLPEEMSTQMQNIMAVASVRSFIYVAVWYLYLTKSKRVRGTYPV